MRAALRVLCIAGGFYLGAFSTGCATHTVQNVPAAAAAAGATDSDQFAAAREQIREALKESGAPSVAIAVARNGEIIWEEGFGWADIENKVPATADTMYSLASITKCMTEMAIRILVERGKLDLDAPVNDYLPKDAQLTVWIGDPKEVTLRRLLKHTAGLPRHENFYNADELAAKPPMEESIRRYGNIVTPPGERYRYSNFGYGILDYVISRVSGMSYADFMQKEIFDPLGMTHSSVDIRPDLARFAATRYDEYNKPMPFYSFDHAGASGVWCSAHDLLRFGMFHMGQPEPDQKPVLSKATLEDMNLTNSGGGMGGVATILRLSRNDGVVVAIVCNKFCDLSGRVFGIVMSAVSPDYAARAAGRQRRWPNPVEQGSLQEFKTPPELLGEWEGSVHTYCGNYSMSLSFKESGEVVAKLEKQVPVLVTDLDFSDGRLTGKMAGRIDTSDTRRHGWEPEHHIELDLKLRGDVLNGAVVTIAGNALSHWVELRRQKAR